MSIGRPLYGAWTQRPNFLDRQPIFCYLVGPWNGALSDHSTVERPRTFVGHLLDLSLRGTGPVGKKRHKCCSGGPGFLAYTRARWRVNRPQIQDLYALKFSDILESSVFISNTMSCLPFINAYSANSKVQE